MMFKEALDGKAFAAYTENLLAPTLKKGGIVVLDNLLPHKVAGH